MFLFNPDTPLISLPATRKGCMLTSGGSQPPTPYNDTNESTSRNPKQGAHCPGDPIDDNGMGRSLSSKDMKRIFSELRRYMTINRPMIILRSCHSAKGIRLTCWMIQQGGGRWGSQMVRHWFDRDWPSELFANSWTWAYSDVAVGQVDGSFIATLPETICVWLLYLAWKSITEGMFSTGLQLFSSLIIHTPVDAWDNVWPWFLRFICGYITRHANTAPHILQYILQLGVRPTSWPAARSVSFMRIYIGYIGSNCDASDIHTPWISTISSSGSPSRSSGPASTPTSRFLLLRAISLYLIQA